MDVKDAIYELIRSSFIETVAAQDDNEIVLVVPLAASVFGQRKLRASPMMTAMEANTVLLLNFGAAQKSGVDSGISWRINKSFRTVAEKAGNDSSAIEAHLPMMEFLARRYSRGWLLLSRVYEESSPSNADEKAKEYLRRYLEDVDDPENARTVWSQLSRLCHSAGDWTGEIQAIVELSSLLGGTGVREISNGLNKWNQLVKQQSLYIAGDDRKILGRRLLQLFEQSSTDACPTDFSRAAWIYIALHDEKRAEDLARQGLHLDPDNEYCLNLAEKLKIQPCLPS